MWPRMTYRRLEKDAVPNICDFCEPYSATTRSRKRSIEPTAKPVSKPASKPVSKSVSKPASIDISKLALKRTSSPTSKSKSNQASKSKSNQASKSKSKPAPKKTSKLTCKQGSKTRRRPPSRITSLPTSRRRLEEENGECSIHESIQSLSPCTCVVLPAAGVGERMGLVTPKQFCDILGTPLICHTINAFQSISWLSHIVVVVSSDRMDYMLEVVKRFQHAKVKVTVCEGAATRHRSIFNGILQVEQVCPAVEVVAIHDGVRPFVDEETVLSVTHAAFQYGAAGMTRPLVSTVVASDYEGLMDHALDRSKYCASEMPQAFRFHDIKTAYQQCSEHDLDYGTECLDLVQKYTKVQVRLITGPDHLWKVTHRKDLYAVESILKEITRRSILVVHDGNEVNDLADQLAQSIQDGRQQAVTRCSFQYFNSTHNQNGRHHDVIFIHNTSKHIGTILRQTVSDMPCWSANIMIHVVKSLAHDDAAILETMSVVKQVTDDVVNQTSPGSMLYGMVLKTNDLPKVVNIVNRLVDERNPTFNGQTFIV